MANIKLVITIDEEDFEIMKHNIAVNNPLCPLSQEKMVAIVAHGTPLPKRLIDADEFTDSLKSIERLHIDDELRINILNAIYDNTLEVESEE